MPVQTSIEFIELVEKSKLLSASQLAVARQMADQESDPKNVARGLIRDGVLNKWQALHLLAGRHALTLGKYRLTDQVEVVGRQRQFFAEEAESGRKVAIQMLSRRQTSQNPEATEQFLEQGRKLSQLEHPAIVPILDVESEGDRHFLVLEQPQGQSLQLLIQDKGPLPTDLVVSYLSQVAQGIAVAHQQGISHGDLRPENVMVDDQGEARVANLGLAGLIEGVEDGDDSEPAGVGPGEYRPPLDWTLPEPAGPAIDLYALGGVMFAALTGKAPGSELTAALLLEQRPDVPEPLVGCFERLIAADASARYEAIGDVVEDLTKVKGTKPTVATPPKRKPTEQPAEKKTAGSSSAIVLTKAAAQAPAKPAAQAPAKPAAKAPSKKTATDQAVDSGPKIAIPGLPDAPGAPAAGTLAIKTKGKRRSTKRPGTKTSAAKGDADSSTDAAVAKPGIPKVAYIIGGASVGGLVVVTALVLLILNVFSGRGQVQVAEANGGAVAGIGADSGAVPGASPDGAESDPALDAAGSTLAEETDPELSFAPTPVTPPSVPDEAATPADESASTDPADSTGADPRADGTGESPQPGTEPAMPDDGQAPKKPSEQAKGDAKPGPEKPAPKPKPPTKEAFADLPALVSLPALDAADALKPKVLGHVHTTPEDQCFIRMRGGEHALRGNRVFAMRNADGGLAERDWEINLRDSSAGAELKIAHLSLNDQSQLVFQWQPEAKDDAAAVYLINCALSMNCRGTSHVLLLRQPTKIPGFEINLKEPATRHTVKLDTLPDAERLRIEIKNVRGVKHKIEPQAVMNADKGEAWIRLQDGGGLLSLKVETEMRRELQLTFSPHVQLNPDGRPERVISRQLQQTKNKLQAAINHWAALVQQGQAIMKSNAPEQQKKQTQQYLRNYENELKTSQENLAKFEAFEQMLEKSKPQVEVRVFYDADGSDVNLLVAGS